MKVSGFTGTRKGMTGKQRESFRALSVQLGFSKLHHGDCVGGDENAHKIVRKITGVKIIIHPPTYQKYRAFCRGDVILNQRPYLDRNKDIVDHSDFLIATPGEFKERLRSGTWSTVRYARKKNKPIYIILPNGEIKKENVEK